jgi:AbrB family transcriptional regulator (stage V sporulation protein T)
MGIQVNVAANGRFVLPADVRKQLGIEVGDTLMLNVDEFGVTLTTAAQRVAKAQALYREYSKGKQPFTVDEFIAEKRADAALERY